MGFELLVAVVMVASHGGLLESTVHPFDLSVGPGMLHLGRAVLDAVLPTAAPEDVLHGCAVPLAVFELDAVVSRDRVHFVGTALMRWRRNSAAIISCGPLVQLDIDSIFGSTVRAN